MKHCHCCDELNEYINSNEYPIRYIENLREYSLEIHDGGYSAQLINYCPWCGSRLPKELRDEWYDLLEEQGIEPFKDTVPKEFETSEWWKKRSL